MIKILADSYNLVQADVDSIILSVIEDYVYGYDRILNAIESNSDLSLYIQNTAVETWIKQMSSHYPQELFEFHKLDPRKYLAEKWNIIIPDYVSNEDILNTNLLEVEITPRAGDSFENVLLEQFYDPVFSSPVFPTIKILDIVFAHDESLWQKNSSNSLLQKVYQQQLNKWRNKAKNEATIMVINMVQENIGQLHQLLMRYKVLRSYKKIGEKLLEGTFINLESLKLNLNNLEVNESEIPETINQVEYYLNELTKPKNSDEVCDYISGLSGLLIIEFEKVENLLVNNPHLITLKVIGTLEGVFTQIKNKVNKRIETIKSLLKPAVPEPPDISWPFETMINWATKAYMPFLMWADSNNFLDNELIAQGDIFSQWLYKNWEDLRSNSKSIVFNILPNNTVTFQNTDVVNLFIIIDNFGWRYVKTLKDQFQAVGLVSTQTKPYLSMLPTVTEFSKKCLLEGKSEYIDIDNKQYIQIVEKGWVPYFNDAKFNYLPDMDALLTLPTIKYNTYIVNYLPIDKSLHQSKATLGMPHETHIKYLLGILVEKALEFINKHGLKNKITIHITSDHGSARIPNQLSNALDTSFFKGDDFEYVTPRLMAVKAERFKELSENLREDCFFLGKTRFGNDRDYLAARKANRFAKAENDQYMHGSLLPEEVIVPYIVFQYATKDIQPLTLALIKNIFRNRQETIELEIANPNEYSAENIIVKIMNDNIESEQYDLDLLETKRKTSFSIRGKFKKTQNYEDNKNLFCMISFETNGKQYKSNLIKLPITIKSMYEMKDNTIFDEFI